MKPFSATIPGGSAAGAGGGSFASETAWPLVPGSGFCCAHHPSAQQLSHVWGLDGGGRAATRLHFVFPSAIPGRGWVGGKVKFLTGYMGPDSKHCFSAPGLDNTVPKM